jgi:cobalt/nickel transport system permease protein
MWIAEVYNHQHKLAQVPTGIRALYWLPAIVLVLLSGSPAYNCMMFAGFNAFLIFACRTRTGNLLSLYRIPLLFVLSGCLLLALTGQSESPFFELSGWAIGIDQEGYKLAVLLFTRSLALISIMYFILLTHSIAEITELLNACKTPPLLVDLFVATYKFIENLRNDSQAMYTAQKCRLGYAGHSPKLQLFSGLMTAVFQRTMQQARQMETAMEARCAQQNYRFLPEARLFRPAQLLLPAAWLVCSFLSFFIYRAYGW